VKRYSDVKNVDDLPDRDSMQKNDEKGGRSNSEKNPRSEQAIWRKKVLNISCDTIRKRLLIHKVKFQSTASKKPLLSKKYVEKRFTWAKENLDRDWDKVIFFG